MNDSLEFRFVTATLSKDYSVYGNIDPDRFETKTLADVIEFDPIKELGGFGLDVDESPCAVMFEHEGKIYLAATRFQRGKRDYANRRIMFSFCWILQGNSPIEKGRACAAFSCIVREWGKVEQKIQSQDGTNRVLWEEELKETDSRGREVWNDKVFFDWRRFTEWLAQTGGVSDFDEDIQEGDIVEIPIGFKVWPPKGCLLKWEKVMDKHYAVPFAAICRPIGR